VLPSWYELPGLVSLEAAAHGKNVVVTRTGTSADYLGDKAFYCTPSDDDSIYSAVMAAYYAPVPQGLADLARSYTWDETARATLAAYQDVLGIQPEVFGKPVAMAAPSAWYDASSTATEFQDALERGEIAAKNMEFELAHELLGKAEAIDPKSARVIKARGAVWLAQSELEAALDCFSRALIIAPTDPKVLSGRGMCEMMAHKYLEAIPYFEKALSIAPDHLVALHQLLDCSYRIEQFDALLPALQNYLALKSDDLEMSFCLAGCLHKQGRDAEALERLESLLSQRPDHAAALELKLKLLSVAKQNHSQPDVTQPNVSQAVVAAAPVTSGIFSGNLQDSLSELSQRMTEWRVRSVESTETSVVNAPAAAMSLPTPPLPTVTAQMASAASQASVVQATNKETVIVDLESDFAVVEEAKRSRDLDKAKEGLAQLSQKPGLSGVDKARANCLEAEIMVLQGDLVGADMMYDIVLKERKDTPRALCGKGALAAEDKRFDEARVYFERALELSPSYDVALAGLGLCEMVGDRTEAAFDRFLEAARSNTENTRAIIGVLQLGYPLKRYGEIETVLEAYLESHPASIDMLYSFAGVLYAQGKMDEARSETDKILIFEPANERALELRRMISERGENSLSL
jgi:tetratricopeptide (TPR) repeat protein